MLSSDPTAFPIEFDPREKRMRGVAIHGDTPFDVPYISEIAPGLWHGGCKDGLVLPAEIGFVVSLYPWERYTLSHDHQERVECTWYDAGLPDEEEILSAARLVNGARVRGISVLVHCQAGLNRSSLVMGTYLVRFVGLTGPQAVDLLRSKRSPAVLCNTAFESYVRSL